MENQIEMKLETTYREFLQTLKSGEEVVNFLNHINYGCRQKSDDFWKSHCLKEEYRGENGCRRLRSEISPDFADRFIKMHILDCDGGIYGT